MVRIWWLYCKLAVDCLCEKSKQLDEVKKKLLHLLKESHLCAPSCSFQNDIKEYYLYTIQITTRNTIQEFCNCVIDILVIRYFEKYLEVLFYFV